MLPERLKDARLAAGLTQTELAVRLEREGVSLTKAALSKYERGRSAPPPTVFRALCRALGVRAGFLLTEPGVSIEWRAFRKRASLSKTRQDRVKVLAARLVESHVELRRTLDPDSAPELPRPRSLRHVEEAEEVAEELRACWKLGTLPIESLTETIEDRGCIVVECEGEDRDFDGLSGWADERFPVIVMGRGEPADRRRLNLAHEVGHLLLEPSEVDEEKAAYRFGAALLVPREVCRAELGRKRRSLSIAELRNLKRKYGLSIAAWIYRATDLGIITDRHAAALWRRMSSLGWRRQEPDELVGRERPARLRQLVLRALAEGIVTPERAEAILPGVVEEAVDRPASAAIRLRSAPPEERKRALFLAAESLEGYDEDELEAMDPEDVADDGESSSR
ncbi:MAG: XRE family transcriptional regulator [Planctomycetota bacterium]